MPARLSRALAELFAAAASVGGELARTRVNPQQIDLRLQGQGRSRNALTAEQRVAQARACLVESTLGRGQQAQRARRRSQEQRSHSDDQVLGGVEEENLLESARARTV